MMKNSVVFEHGKRVFLFVFQVLVSVCFLSGKNCKSVKHVCLLFPILGVLWGGFFLFIWVWKVWVFMCFLFLFFFLVLVFVSVSLFFVLWLDVVVFVLFFLVFCFLFSFSVFFEGLRVK